MNKEGFSAIAALRPAALARRTMTAKATADRSNAERLAEILGAECRRNPLGSHLVLRRLFSEPCIHQAGPRALRLLAPGAADEAADPRTWLFLDTETTGLAGGTGTYVFMVGIAWWGEDGLTVEQFFMRDYSDEPSLLHELSRILAGRPVLVTFNGKSFDWPLLETRFRMARLGPIAPPRVHMDLLHPARQLWRYRLRSVALSALERQVLELDRGHDIPSETIPGRYFDFLRGGPAEPVAEIFHHNQMDLRGLAILAVHISRLLEDPENQECEATELFGISRLLQRRGEAPLAELCYERALSGGLADLPGRSARRELALLAKKNRDFGRANQLWQELLDRSNDGFEAYEQLAMYFEHQARDYEKAAGLTREALTELREALTSSRILPHQYRRWHAGLQHRLDRLVHKNSTARRASATSRPESEGQTGSQQMPEKM